MPPFRQPSPSRIGSLLGILRRNQDLLRNAGSLAATTGVTSVLGFAFWIYADHVFTLDAAGYGTAAVSTMTLLGTIGMFGLGTMLIGELPHNTNRGGLMMAAFIASFLGSFVLAIVFSLGVDVFGGHFPQITGTLSRAGIFAVGVAITGATLVFDDATIGLMRGGLQLSRNVTVSIAKMAALPVAALVLHDALGVGIMLAWVIGTLVSLVPTAITIKRGGGRILYRPDWRTFWRLGKVSLAHNWLNLAITVPTKLIPVLVAIAVSSPASVGAFYIAAMLASFLSMVPMHLSTVLFAIASAAPEKISEKLRFVLRMSLVIGIPAGLVLGLAAHLVLSVFNSKYGSLATGPLWLLIIGYIPGLPNTVYIAVCRATGRVVQATWILSTFAAIQMVAVVVGGRVDGLYGVAYGLLAVAVLQALITTPAVLRAAFGTVTIKRAAAPVTAGQARLRAAELDEEMRLRQEAGLAALIALATTVAPSPPRGPMPNNAVPKGSVPHSRMHNSGPNSGVPGGAGGGQQADRTQQNPAATRHRHRRSTVPITTGNPILTDTSWWPDLNEAEFRARQESSMAALIAIATHAARF
jgi:O-antigen/teichoic acid export membrane protein